MVEEKKGIFKKISDKIDGYFVEKSSCGCGCECSTEKPEEKKEDEGKKSCCG